MVSSRAAERQSRRMPAAPGPPRRGHRGSAEVHGQHQDPMLTSGGLTGMARSPRDASEAGRHPRRLGPDRRRPGGERWHCPSTRSYRPPHPRHRTRWAGRRGRPECSRRAASSASCWCARRAASWAVKVPRPDPRIASRGSESRAWFRHRSLDLAGGCAIVQASGQVAVMHLLLDQPVIHRPVLLLELGHLGLQLLILELEMAQRRFHLPR